MNRLIQLSSLLSVALVAGAAGVVNIVHNPGALITSLHSSKLALADAPVCTMQEKNGVYFASCGDFVD